MNLIDKVRKHQLEVRKVSQQVATAEMHAVAKIEASVLTTLIGEAQVDGKDPTDEQLVKVIQKFVKNIDQFIEVAEDSTSVGLKIERNVLVKYLPQELKEEDIRDFLDTAVQNGDKITKAYMSKLNMLAKASGKVVDNKLASVILQSYL